MSSELIREQRCQLRAIADAGLQTLAVAGVRFLSHMPRAGHVWACVLFRGACVLGSRVLDGGMCGACVFFG